LAAEAGYRGNPGKVKAGAAHRVFSKDLINESRQGNCMSKIATDINSRTRVLISSVGSLVGQNILDSLEYPEGGRREHVWIIGTNSIAESPNNFRCDECHLVPPTNSAGYADVMRKILTATSPDAIFCGRDADTEALWRLLASDAQLPGKLCYGRLETVLYALDKWQTHVFCQKHDLPCADTFLVGGEDASGLDLQDFIRRIGFPMVAKPVQGFASKGVFFVRNQQEIELVQKFPGYILQEYLGPSNAMDAYFESLRGLPPLFTQAPNVTHNTCHVPILKDGTIGDICCLRNHHNFGAVTRLERVDDRHLEETAIRFAKAFISEGGWGPLSIQFRRDARGDLKAQEMNLRTTGSTFPRLMMGQDEVGIFLNEMVPGCRFPIHRGDDTVGRRIVVKTLGSRTIHRDHIDTLEASGQWRCD